MSDPHHWILTSDDTSKSERDVQWDWMCDLCGLTTSTMDVEAPHLNPELQFGDRTACDRRRMEAVESVQDS